MAIPNNYSLLYYSRICPQSTYSITSMRENNDRIVMEIPIYCHPAIQQIQSPWDFINSRANYNSIQIVRASCKFQSRNGQGGLVLRAPRSPYAIGKECYSGT